MSMLDDLKVKLIAASEAVQAFERNAAFVKARREHEEALKAAEKNDNDAYGAMHAAERAAYIRLGFRTQDGKLRRSYLDAIAKVIGISFDDREVLARENRHKDDPFMDAADKYANRVMHEDPAVKRAHAAHSATSKAQRSARDALHDFTNGYRRAVHDQARIKNQIDDMERTARERRDRLEQKAGSLDPAAVKKHAAEQLRYRAARKLLEEIAEGKVKLEVEP